MSLIAIKTIPMVSWGQSSFVDDPQIYRRDIHGHSLQGWGIK